MSRIIHWLVLASLLFAGLPTTGAELRTVALSSTPAPGTDTGWNFSDFHSINLNNAGQIAFIANLRSGSSSLGSGAYVEVGDTLRLIARNGDPPPGIPGGFFSEFIALALNEEGDVAFWAGTSSLAPPRGSVLYIPRGGIWKDVGGTLQLVVRNGDTALNDSSGAVFAGAGIVINMWVTGVDFVFNDAGQIAFTSPLRSLSSSNWWGEQNAGVWLNSGEQVNLVALTTEAAPGMSTESYFRSFPFAPVLNSAGRIAFLGFTTGGPRITDKDSYGIWSQGHGPLRLVAHEGGPAPGTAGRQFSQFAPPVINSAGDTAFLGQLDSESGDTDSGIWSERSGLLNVVTRRGDPAPGFSARSSFQNFSAPLLNDAGDVAFWASVAADFGDGAPSDVSGIWAERDGNLRLVAREGQVAPGTNGALFSDFSLRFINRLPRNFEAYFNGAGQVAFRAALQSGVAGVDHTNHIGIWAEDRDGVLRLVARTGDTLDVAAGDPKVIRELYFSHATDGDFARNFYGTGNGDGRTSLFNNRGQVAFRARFADFSSGVFVSNVAAVPEPATISLAAILAIAAAGGRRARRSHRG